MLRIYLILIRIQILDPYWKKMDPDPYNFFQIYWIFLTKNCQNLCLFFAYFYAKPWRTIQKSGNFKNLSFFNSSDLGLESKNFFLQFFVVCLPLGSESVDLHILQIRTFCGSKALKKVFFSSNKTKLYYNVLSYITKLEYKYTFHIHILGGNRL